ncbi:MAG: molybdenum ABC transporter ATP-binding protein [Gammaproteobacteria bacterium]|nr:molybdenum ABC transporter ATP-binding protein [Gammaproteobacteria bacterium]
MREDIHASIQLQQSGGFTLNVNLCIPGSGITVLFGPSGAGKTTLLRLLAGLEGYRKEDSISIVAGEQVWHKTGKPPQFVATHERSIGYVFQHPQLFPHLNVLDNLRYAYRRQQKESSLTISQVSTLLGLDGILHQSVLGISGGERQRAAIARVLLNNPRYILMDEPLGSIDVAARSQILPYLESLHRELNVPIVYVTHSLEEMHYLADKVILMHNGQVADEGGIVEISSKADTELAKQESAASIIHCKVMDIDEEYGLTSLSFGDQKLIVARTDLKPGTMVRIQIQARDLSITLAPDSQSSILNILSCQIESISVTDRSRALISLKTGNQYLLARITRQSLDRLGLIKGQSVFAQIKSVAPLTEHYVH